MLIAKTQNLLLAEFLISDAAFILQLLNTRGWLQFIGDRNVKTIADAECYIANVRNSYAKNGYGLYKVVLNNNHQPIGLCGLVKRDFLPNADIGFALLPTFENKGFAFEAASAVLILAKNKLSLKKLAAICSPENTSSIKLLNKLNMQFEKMIVFPGETKESMLFGLYI